MDSPPPWSLFLHVQNSSKFENCSIMFNSCGKRVAKQILPQLAGPENIALRVGAEVKRLRSGGNNWYKIFNLVDKASRALPHSANVVGPACPAGCVCCSDGGCYHYKKHRKYAEVQSHDQSYSVICSPELVPCSAMEKAMFSQTWRRHNPED